MVFYLLLYLSLNKCVPYYLKIDWSFKYYLANTYNDLLIRCISFLK